MEEFVKTRNRLLSTKLIKELANRNIEAFFVESKKDALAKALELIPENSSIGWGGSFSLQAIGIKQALMDGNYKVFNRDVATSVEERVKIEREAYCADYFLTSSNAITEDGVLVNLDGSGNRVSAIASGPSHVIFVIGMNKVTKDVDSAISRVRNLAAPSNVKRYNLKTPCNTTGFCADCKSPESICCHLLITRLCRQTGRIKVVLVNDDLGF